MVTEFVTGAYPDPENPQPPGPWDPVIRRALTRLRDSMGPNPQPWRVFGPTPDPWRVFGPTPNPWRLAAILVAEEVVDYASRLQDFADLTGHSESPAPSYLSRFVDDIELCPPYWKWPFPPPQPPKRGETLFDPVDLVTMGVVFEHLADTIANERLRNEIKGAGAKLIEKGTAKM
jgi:hypothetical protein